MLQVYPCEKFSQINYIIKEITHDLLTTNIT